MEKLTLYGRQGWGSVLVETQLVWYGMPFEFRGVGDLFSEEDAQRELEKINPVVQLPTVLLPDGGVMTESGAITLWLAEQAGSAELVPEPGAADRARFLRWLFFIASNIYPTYSYVDDPARFVPDEPARSEFAERVGDRAKMLYRILNDEASQPWFLGDRFSALDIYVCTMTHWRPRRPWFEDNTPNLVAIADATQAVPKLAEVWARNYPDG